MKQQKRYGPFLFAWLVFLISEVVAIFIIHSLISFGHVIWSAEEITKPLWSNHALVMGVTMIVINGHGMAMFRLFPRCKTAYVKHIHALIHTVIIAGSGYGYYLIHIFKNENDNDINSHFTFNRLHTYLALLTGLFYIFQWITAFFVYFFCNQRRRKLFASSHNFLGICVLQLSIITATVQLHEMDYEKNPKDQNAEHAMILMVIYGILINIIVLNPYLEWRLVGPL